METKKRMGRPPKVKPIPEPEKIVIPEPTPEPTPEPPKDTPKYTVERAVEGGGVAAKQLHSIICGVCEHCGTGRLDAKGNLVEDFKVDPDTQIAKCEHYKGTKIRCSYCPPGANWKSNIITRKHYIFESPFEPGKLLIVCDDMLCGAKHNERMKGGK